MEESSYTCALCGRKSNQWVYTECDLDSRHGFAVKICGECYADNDEYKICVCCSPKCLEGILISSRYFGLTLRLREPNVLFHSIKDMLYVLSILPEHWEIAHEV